jgi:amidase
MRDVDVLVAPSAPGAAPEGLAGTGDPLFSRLWSALGVPCVQVPVDATDDGLPLGVTVVAPRWLDALALGAAQWLEGPAGA